MLISGPGHAACTAYEAARERDVHAALTFASAKEAFVQLDRLEAEERGNDALGENKLRWHARVRHAAHAWLREHAIEAANERVERLTEEVAEWRAMRAQAPLDRTVLDAWSDAADWLSAQVAALAGMMARGSDAA